MSDAELRLAELRRLTTAARDAGQAEERAAAAYRAARARRKDAQEAVEKWLRADSEPCPLFDQATPEPVADQGEADELVTQAEEVFPEPVAWNVYDAYRRKDAGRVMARCWSEAQRLAHGHYPEVPEGACLVVRVKDEQWTGAASQPDVWRHQGIGLALRSLPVATVQALAAAGLTTLGAADEWFQEEAARESRGEKPRKVKGIKPNDLQQINRMIIDTIHARKAGGV